ncbi:hypothetical protein ACIRO3_19300 [Streptomyces sp. NPDC102278]|uniref:hypothetical protein n=1 Tax=Streptomyces sp. NPDC102278 TaxID=3366152 RepID=UPI00381E5F40
MERAEVMKRVIGILTESQEIRRSHEAGAEAGPASEPGVVTLLLSEMIPHFSVPADATPLQVGRIVGETLAPAMHTIVGSFAAAFNALAAVHDSGQTDVSSMDVLRELALRVEAGAYDRDPDDGPDEGGLDDA